MDNFNINIATFLSKNLYTFILYDVSPNIYAKTLNLLTFFTKFFT
ncbi:hypothetical protein B4110_2501 [Parageobacillus toebii]|uniref:Uncharacterized protein n=1 Tax=Parageobacillus toebii TaxID=153151 RepID=A0A150MMI0_9BACL|nr:hypothetical protein B4110_2501 [Parageobacillus toebii]